MRHLADWLAGLLGDVRVEFLPTGDPFHRV